MSKTKDRKEQKNREAKEKKAQWKFTPPKKHSYISAVAIEKNIVFSETDAWSVYRIPSVSYEYLSDQARVNIAQSYNAMAENLARSGEKPVHAHQIVTSRPFDVLDWGTSLYNKVQPWDPSPGFNKHLVSEMRRVDQIGFAVKETFFLVHLGKRTKEYASSATGTGLMAQAFKTLDKFANIKDPLVPDEEIEYWKMKEDDFGNTILNSSVGTIAGVPNFPTRASSDTIAWLIKKNLYPGMYVPEVSASPHESWGYGEMRLLGIGQLERKMRHIEITQFDPETGEEATGYRATLSFSRFPDVMNFPEMEPWIHSASALPFDVDIHSRITIEPALKVKKEVGRKAKDAIDQLKNAEGSGATTPLEMQEQYAVATELEYDLNRERRPWVYARHRAIIEATSEEELRQNAQILIDHYKSAHRITVSWTQADQKSLFLETMPADKVRDTAFHQRHKLDILGGGMPHGAGTVGDTIIRKEGDKPKGWISHYLGYTTSRVQEPVFLSVHSAISQNNSPGLAITGSPGGGKSFSAFTLTYYMALDGVWTIYLDPKADAGPIVDLPGLETARKIDLRNGNDGLLDAFSIGRSIPEQQLLALETIRLLVGSVRDEQETKLIEAITFVGSADHPSLDKVVNHLFGEKQKGDIAAGALYEKLNLIRRLPFANLCFSSKEKPAEIRPEQGLTVVTLLGLSLPSAEMPEEAYSYENRLAVGVLYLLTSFTRQLMLSSNKRHPKAIVIDEAWAITSTPQGAKIVPEVARMGRSHNTALVLVSQNAGDLLHDGITNSISIKMAYRANVSGEVDNVIKFFDLEPDQGVERTIEQLANGECLIKDSSQRIARVQIDAWNPGMKEAFDTNPDTRNDKNSGSEK